MNPNDQPNAPVSQDTLNNLQQPDDVLLRGERCLGVVHRHPIGIIALYFQSIIGALAIIAVMFIGIPSWLGHTSGNTYALLVAGSIFAVAMLVFVLLIGTYVYRQSRLIITEISIILVVQNGLFGRRISRLSISNVEDVTANTNGVLPSIFGYGVLNVETAGEQENFIFTYCPRPNLYAEKILEARQDYANKTGKE